MVGCESLAIANYRRSGKLQRLPQLRNVIEFALENNAPDREDLKNGGRFFGFFQVCAAANLNDTQPPVFSSNRRFR